MRIVVVETSLVGGKEMVTRIGPVTHAYVEEEEESPSLCSFSLGRLQQQRTYRGWNPFGRVFVKTSLGTRTGA